MCSIKLPETQPKMSWNVFNAIIFFNAIIESMQLFTILITMALAPFPDI